MTPSPVLSSTLPETAADHELSLLKTAMLSREMDRRENLLFRQGRGSFHLPSAGHEAVAGIAQNLRSKDWIYCYYRDRALLLAHGVPAHDMALGFFAKATSSSGGRQMASHFSYKPLNVVSCASPTGLQCLPASGTAWGLKRHKHNRSLVLCSIGDAATRQGEFLEAIAFAIQEKLPIVFLVHDNGYGISTPTDHMSALALGLLPAEITTVIEDAHASDMASLTAPIFDGVRRGMGPQIIWAKMPRLMSHTSSDDQRKYRSAEDLGRDEIRDPVALHVRALVSQGMLTPCEHAQIEAEVKSRVKLIYEAAEIAPTPTADTLMRHVFSEAPARKPVPRLAPPSEHTAWTMREAFVHTLDRILSENKKAMVFGEDVEEPKGGVFGLTRGLSHTHPQQVINAPLAEATIAGTASGLAIAGYTPIFELQFIDFSGPAFNQIANQIATLRWRTNGQFGCPLILYAPCGSYFPGGGPWHSQTNESWFAHVPGLKVYMPSDANDAASMLYAAAHGSDPVLILLPKNQFQRSVPVAPSMALFPEKAQLSRTGADITVVSWGNCTEVAMQAAHAMEAQDMDAEVINLKAITPCDWATLHNSVRKTGRVIVIQEDNKTCSFGQAIISELTSDCETWAALKSPPQLLSRQDVLISFNAEMERISVPQAYQIVASAKTAMGTHYG